MRPRNRSTRACSCRAATRATTARSPPPGACSSRRGSSRAALPESLPGHGARQRRSSAQTLALQTEHPEARVIAGVEGHQPAHQGRHARRACRGLLQRQDHRGRRRPLHRHGARCPRISGRSTARTCARGRKPSALSTRSQAPRCSEWQPNQCVYEDTPQGIEAHRAQDRWRHGAPSSSRATTAASGTASGASPPAIASRTSR